MNDADADRTMQDEMLDKQRCDHEDAALRENLGQIVRDVWRDWAMEQPNPKPSWLVPWAELSEPDKEVDRRRPRAEKKEPPERYKHSGGEGLGDRGPCDPLFYCSACHRSLTR